MQGVVRGGNHLPSHPNPMVDSWDCTVRCHHRHSQPPPPPRLLRHPLLPPQVPPLYELTDAQHCL